ncbi:hypothetical protein Bca52824_057191 [Brassica carinata]|uniref:PUM-HD domain-containing protein n=1 Tax=Brassica carinata TaxID=52824 RepID=A0A8X7UEJ5_BRACI|nr:hypothetical protein Bca52824_057191 [Brassica carinata]
MDDFEFLPDELRGRTSYSTDVQGAPPTCASARFRFSGDSAPSSSLTSISNPFVNQPSRKNMNTTAGLCQNLSKMGISDDEERSSFTGSHPPFLENLHGCFRLTLGGSSHRQSLTQSSHRDNSRMLGLLAREDYFPNNHIRGFTENTSRRNKDYYHLFEEQEQNPRRHISLSAVRGVSSKCMKEALSPDLVSVLGIYGSVYLTAKDQMGCRFLQKLMEERNSLDVMVIFRGLINHVIELGMDQFGNFLIQKLILISNEEQTRVVQKLIETVRTKTEINLVKLALKPGLLSLVRDLNGNHVIQSCLKFLSPEDNKFILEGATRFCATIATHKHGCCVLQHCVKYSVGAERENLIAEIARNSLHLAQDPFGNYVVQYIIEQNLGGVNVMFELKGNYVRLATQKFSSHVVEKCLEHYPESRSQIVRELVSVPNFERLLQDPFANYVIQSALSKAKGYVRASLVDKVRTFGNLKMNPYCKRIFSKSRHLRK